MKDCMRFILATVGIVVLAVWILFLLNGAYSWTMHGYYIQGGISLALLLFTMYLIAR